MGLNIVHPDGKVCFQSESIWNVDFDFASQPAKTIFTRLHYDGNTDTSVLHCMKPFKPFLQLRLTLIALGQPFTGRCKLPV
jgi:tRNA pseudouridine synthase 9